MFWARSEGLRSRPGASGGDGRGIGRGTEAPVEGGGRGEGAGEATARGRRGWEGVADAPVRRGGGSGSEAWLRQEAERIELAGGAVACSEQVFALDTAPGLTLGLHLSAQKPASPLHDAVEDLQGYAARIGPTLGHVSSTRVIGCRCDSSTIFFSATSRTSLTASYCAYSRRPAAWSFVGSFATQASRRRALFD